jgi:hypothetical protein
VEFKRKYNKLRETNALKANAKTRKKKYKDIIRELGECQISLKDIANGKKLDGFMYLLDKNGATLDEYVILQQYSKAIVDRDTKSAEFLRDSSGQKPSTQVDLNDNRNSGLSEMSTEELREMVTLLKKQANKDE